MELSQIKKIPQQELQKIIDRVRAKIKKSTIVKNLFKEYKVDLDEIDLVPMCFADLPVSARTDKGIIYFNYKLLMDGDFENDDHYMVHELTHFLQQTTGNNPTPGFTDDTYLKDSNEQEGFNVQTRYIADTQGKEEAQEYANQVLDHHQLKGKERKEIKNKILNTKKASDARVFKLHKDRLEELVQDIGKMTSAQDHFSIAIARIMNVLDSSIKPLAEQNQDQEILEELAGLQDLYQEYQRNKNTPIDYYSLMSLAIRVFVRSLKDNNY